MLAYLTRQLIGEHVGLESIGLDLWQLYFGELKLGVVDERLKSVIRPRQSVTYVPGFTGGAL
jgi:hypothetical protein